jgi:predicted transcriptional regulator
MLQYDSMPTELQKIDARKSIQRQVMTIVKSFEGAFDVDDVVIAYYTKHNKVVRRGTISQCLTRLIKYGRVVRDKRGVYTKIKATVAQPDSAAHS